MANIRKGDTVRQVVTPVQGTVDSFQVDQETGTLQFLVVWTDEAGEVQSKYFLDGEVEVVPAAE